MIAKQTISQHLEFNKTIKPASHGVLTLFGYGIQVRVDRGHLLVEDGIGSERRQFRLPRVGHGLRRLVVTGNDGMISLAAVPPDAPGSGAKPPAAAYWSKCCPRCARRSPLPCTVSPPLR